MSGTKTDRLKSGAPFSDAYRIRNEDFRKQLRAEGDQRRLERKKKGVITTIFAPRISDSLSATKGALPSKMADAPNAQTVEYQWAYNIVDSSRVSTFLISMLLIVYGSFRSLNMEQEARDRANGSTNCLLNPSAQSQSDNNVQTLDTLQALCLPLGASISLLVMFFFFDSMQMLFAICTASK